MTESQKAAIRVLKFWCLVTSLHTAGFPREADLQLVAKLAEGHDVANAETVATEYVWDHLMGEPDSVGIDDMLETYRQMREVFNA